ncbi:MAG: ABC transporter ATP-binding protein [Sphaerochaetaceae bacterium]|nr:ABC transporter ATP-binding protein [Sphaerochaetaceae bacterium]
MMQESSISINNVSFSYEGYEHIPLFSNLHLEVPKGSHMLLLAPPDSGKSTLARLLCALVPKYQAGTFSGSLIVGRKDVTESEPWELTDICSLVCQDPQEQLLMTTCKDEIAFPLESLKVDKPTMERRVKESLKSWNLHHVGEANPQELSGGERKRLLLAVTEAIAAPVLILDEPFDDLDAYWRGELINRIQTSNSTVLVMASRYINEFHGTFDRYGLLLDRHIEVESEEDIVMRFETMCDAAFAPSKIEHLATHAHKICCEHVVALHPRKSMGELKPFTLHCDKFHLESEEIVALVGPNGSGKSTFSRALCGLDEVQSGTFSYDDAQVERKHLQRIVGYVFQNPDFELFLPTVKDELMWSIKNDLRKSKDEKESLVATCATMFGLNLNATVATMGYGMRKHLQAAIHYMLNRPFYILDELDSGITYAAAFEMVTLLKSRGAGILLITHDRSFAANLAERTYTMSKGTLIAEAFE